MYRQTRDTSALMSRIPNSQSDLPTRRMLDSYREACIPLGRDPTLRLKYVNAYHHVRFGRIMEDLDTMAGWSYFFT